MLLTGSRGCAAENAGTLKARCLDCCRSLCWAKGHRCFGTTTSSSHPTTPVMPEDPPTPPRYIPPPLTLPVAPSPPLGLYARFRLPSRFRKLEGLSFISANWMEYSWPFQWNQLTPCKDKDEVWEITHSLLLLSDFTALVSDCRLFSNSGTEAQQSQGVGKHTALATSTPDLYKPTHTLSPELPLFAWLSWQEEHFVSHVENYSCPLHTWDIPLENHTKPSIFHQLTLNSCFASNCPNYSV